MGEPSESIHTHAQATYTTQLWHFLNKGSTNIVWNADMCVAEIRQCYKMQAENQSLITAVMSQLIRIRVSLNLRTGGWLRV
jgi:hypothetical protein